MKVRVSRLKQYQKWILSVLLWVFFLAFLYGMIRLDLFLNPWILDVAKDWVWYNYFTTHHGFVGVYLLGGWPWLLLKFFTALFTGAYIVYLVISSK